MPDRDVVLAKIAVIQKCLRRIKDVTDLNPDGLDELDIQDIFVLNLQRAVQSAIDLATHVVASAPLVCYREAGEDAPRIAGAYRARK